MRYQVKVHDDDREHDGEDGWLTYEWDTEAEAQAFYEGVSWVNDSALTIEKPEPIPEPEVTAHCDTCGAETTATDLPRPGSPCGRPVPAPDPYRPPHVETATTICPGTYVEGPLPVFVLTRLEEVDVTYDVKALTLDEAFDRLRSWDEDAIVERFEDAAAWFEAGEVRYLGEDDDWHYEGADVRPQLASEEGS